MNTFTSFRKRPTAILLFLVLIYLLQQVETPAQKGWRLRSKKTTASSRFTSTGRDWPTYGGTLNLWRYSSLTQINRRNVKKLQPVWTFQTGATSPYMSFESTPLVIDGVMYVTSPKDEVFALKADTGDMIWHFSPCPPVPIFPPDPNASALAGCTTPTPSPPPQAVPVCCGYINRGVAYDKGRVFIATLDARLIALDAKTGRPIPTFGQNGTVIIEDYTKGYSETAAPIIADGKILLGVAGAEFQTRGFFSAYDVNTGKLIWRWHTLPAPDEPGGDTWKTPGSYLTGGGSTWMNAAVDLENRQVIFGVGNPNPDFAGGNRDGDNLYTCSVVALDIDTGKMRWYFQQVKHDLWDYDQAAAPILIDSSVSGRRVQAVGVAAKLGWFYILDRKTGKSLIPLREIEVPQDPQQATAKTQIIPTNEPFVQQLNMFQPPPPSADPRRGVRIAPAISGGSEWSPLAFNPKTNLVYIDAVHKPMVYSYNPQNTQQFTAITLADEKLSGAFTAIDVNTGKVRWRTPTVPHPVGGLMTTASLLVFAGEANGYFNALDAITGRRLWQFNCGAGVNAAPMSYEVNGRQYIAVSAGGLNMESFTSGPFARNFFRRGDTVFVFALPR